MRALIQRVTKASVAIDGAVHNEITAGFLILLGATHTDTNEGAAYLAQRCANLRVFEDAEGKMNLSLKDTGGSALVISQFTLYADTRRGNRPSFIDAAPPHLAEQRYEEFVSSLRNELGEERVRTGVFRAMMKISLVNDGPVTIMLESKQSTPE